MSIYSSSLLFANCVCVSDAQVWPDIAERLYVADTTIDDCSSGKTSLRQLGGSSFIFSNGGGWVGTTVLCNEHNTIKQLFGSSTAASPALVPSWVEMASARNVWINPSSLRVTSVPCGKLLLFLLFMLLLLLLQKNVLLLILLLLWLMWLMMQLVMQLLL